MIYQIQHRQSHPAICFLAPAGLGKTSLLKQARRNLQEKDWICGYSSSSPDGATAILDFLRDARQALPPGRIGAKFLARLREFNVTAGPVGLGVKLGDLDEHTSYEQLWDLLTSLGKLAKRKRVGVALLIDEAQVLSAGDLDRLFRAVLSLDDLPIAVIIAGLPSITSTLSMSDWTSPPVLFEYLRPLNKEEARFALVTPITDSGAEIEPAALDRLSDFTMGHPLTLQMVGSAAWIDADREISDYERLVIRERHSLTAIDSTRSQLTISVYEPVWRQCDEPERTFLAALAFSTSTNRNGWELETRLEGKIPSPYQVAGSLLDRGIIYRDDTSVEFVVPGFEEFIRRRAPRPPSAQK
jgi:hypothetical protein